MPPKRKFKPKIDKAQKELADQEKKAEEKADKDRKQEEIRIKREEKEKKFKDKKSGFKNRKNTLQERSVFDTEIPVAIRRGATGSSTVKNKKMT